MAFSHIEIVEFIGEEIENLTILMKCYPKRHRHLEESDDDYVFVEHNMERWADRKMPVEGKNRLEQEADAFLAAAH